MHQALSQDQINAMRTFGVSIDEGTLSVLTYEDFVGIRDGRIRACDLNLEIGQRMENRRRRMEDREIYDQQRAVLERGDPAYRFFMEYQNRSPILPAYNVSHQRFLDKNGVGVSVYATPVCHSRGQSAKIGSAQTSIDAGSYHFVDRTPRELTALLVPIKPYSLWFASEAVPAIESYPVRFALAEEAEQFLRTHRFVTEEWNCIHVFGSSAPVCMEIGSTNSNPFSAHARIVAGELCIGHIQRYPTIHGQAHREAALMIRESPPPV